MKTKKSLSQQKLLPGNSKAPSSLQMNIIYKCRSQSA